MYLSAVAILEILQELRLGFHTLSQSIPQIVEVWDITPSAVCCSSKGVSVNNYFRLLDALHILPPHILPMSVEVAVSKYPEFHWRWSKLHSEADSYQPILLYLRSIGFAVEIVEDGQKLQPNKELFFAELWTLRSRPDASGRAEKIVLKARIHGRTDLVCLDRELKVGSCILSHAVRFAIEIKKAEDFNQDRAIREATVQLLGLCASNTLRTPCVILSNLATKHFVIHLELPDSAVCYFEIVATQCRTFSLAVALADEISMRPCITQNFGRAMTPSPPRSDLDEQISFAGEKERSEPDLVTRFHVL
jgi:hypothetical protein